MPLYDFRCPDCGRKVTLFYKTFAAYEQAEAHTCPRCGGQRLKRRIGRVAIAKSEDARLDALSDDAMLANLDEDDPRAVGQLMRRMSREMGEDLGEEFDEVVDRLEKGQPPEEIEAAMPGLADDAAGSDAGFDDDF